MARKNILLGDFLVQQGIINAEQLREALKYHHEKGVRLGRALIELGYVSEEQIIKSLSEQLGVQYVRLKTYRLDPLVLKLIPANIAWHYLALPLFRIRERLTVAMVNPLDIFAIDALTRASKMKIEPVVCSESEIREALKKYYPRASERRQEDREKSEPRAEAPRNGYLLEVERVIEKLLQEEARQAFVVGDHLRVDFGEKLEKWDLPEGMDRRGFIRILCSLGEDSPAAERTPHRFVIHKEVDGRVCHLHVLAGNGVDSETATITVQMVRQGLPRWEGRGRWQEFVQQIPQARGLVVVAAPDLYLLDAAYYAIWSVMQERFVYPLSIENQPTLLVPNTAQLASFHPAEQLAMIRYARSVNCDLLMLKNVTDAQALQQALQAAEFGLPVIAAVVSRKPWRLPRLFASRDAEGENVIQRFYFVSELPGLCPSCRKPVEVPSQLAQIAGRKEFKEVFDDANCSHNGEVKRGRHVIECLWPARRQNGHRNGNPADPASFLQKELRKSVLQLLREKKVGLSAALELLGE